MRRNSLQRGDERRARKQEKLLPDSHCDLAQKSLTAARRRGVNNLLITRALAHATIDDEANAHPRPATTESIEGPTNATSRAANVIRPARRCTRSAPSSQFRRRNSAVR